jgi:hypothetical protein
MAKILVVGSRKAFDPVEFQSACRAIGRAIAERNHTIVAASCGAEDAETWVLDGANAGTKTTAKTSLIPFAPAQPNSQDLIQTAGVGSRWPNLLVEPPFQTKGPWAVGQAVALIRSDAALLIGGGPLTANVGPLALELDKPYYAVSALGGAAEALANEDFSKHRTMGMKQRLIAPSPNDPSFGEKVVGAIEFLIDHRKESVALRNSALILVFSLAILALFLGFLFRHDPFGNEPRLVYTTCAGALVGVLLAFLIGRVVDRSEINISELLGQTALASFLGVLYGFFALEAGGFYKVVISKMCASDLDSLALKMAMLGVGVGALLGPASKRALDQLRQTSKLAGD